jgi:hypothetical protein
MSIVGKNDKILEKFDANEGTIRDTCVLGEVE